MRARHLIVGAATLCACGRVGFDRGGRLDDANSDGISDVLDNSSLCIGTSTLVCDGFEAGQLDPRWELNTLMGALTLDLARPYRGLASLRARVTAVTTATTNPRASLRTYDRLGTITGTVYARVWAYFASPHPTTEFHQLLNFVDDGGLGISLGTRDGFIISNDYTSSVLRQSTTVQLPLDRWTCLQMEMPSGTATTARIFVDGAEVTDVAITKATPQPMPTQVILGNTWIGSISSLPANELWMDELIVDSAPTTCAQ